MAAQLHQRPHDELDRSVVEGSQSEQFLGYRLSGFAVTALQMPFSQRLQDAGSALAKTRALSLSPTLELMRLGYGETFQKVAAEELAGPL